VANINRVTITGNLTRDPDLRELPSGTAVCELGVAVNHRRKDQATDQIKKVAGQVEGYANDAMDKLRDTGAGEVAGNLKGAVDKSVKDQPIATLALAAAIGFVLGAIWKA